MAAWFGCKCLRRKRSDEGQNNPGQITDDVDGQNFDGAPDAKSWLLMDDEEDSWPRFGFDDEPTTPMNAYQRQHTKGTRNIPE